MSEFKRYRKSQIVEIRTYEAGDDLRGVSISETDKEHGSPKAGDMIARNAKNHADQWLVAETFFRENYEAVS